MSNYHTGVADLMRSEDKLKLINDELTKGPETHYKCYLNRERRKAIQKIKARDKKNNTLVF